MFNWYKPDGSIVSAVDDLVITSINRTEAGIYTCNVSIILNPTEPTGYTETKSDGKTTNVVVQYLDPVVIFTDKTQVEEGGRINITCSTNSYPVASIIWFNDIQQIQVKNTNKGSYIKEDVSCLDTSDYSCSASNTAFTSSVNKTLDVLVKCSPRQDPRVTPIPTVTGNITEVVNLVADVISYPPPSFTWYYIEDNMVIHISNNGSYQQIDTNISINTYKSTLTINITSTSIYRMYMINVSNAEGEEVLQFSLEIQSVPDTPYGLIFEPPLQNIICVEWKPGFNGGATQKFTVHHSTNKISWIDSPSISDSKDGQLIKYCITDLKPETEYYIRVVAINIFGSSQPAYFTSDDSKAIKTIKEAVVKSGSGSDSGLIGGVVGAVIISIVIVIVGIIVIRRRRHSKNSGRPRTGNSHEIYDTFHREALESTYQELNIRKYENLENTTSDNTDDVATCQEFSSRSYENLGNSRSDNTDNPYVNA